MIEALPFFGSVAVVYVCWRCVRRPVTLALACALASAAAGMLGWLAHDPADTRSFAASIALAACPPVGASIIALMWSSDRRHPVLVACGCFAGAFCAGLVAVFVLLVTNQIWAY